MPPPNTTTPELRRVIDLAPCFQPLYASFKYPRHFSQRHECITFATGSYFNLVQSDCFDVGYESDVNMVRGKGGNGGRGNGVVEVVASPTGSGKTVVMELCMLRLFRRNVGGDGRFVARNGGMKVIYIAPTRSLVQERVRELVRGEWTAWVVMQVRDWNERLGTVLGVKVRELTGDIENVRSQEMDEADVICATPEKFGPPEIIWMIRDLFFSSRCRQ